MNNIYKVIWSKAKNCYVVASEIARSHTKSATGSEKIGGVTRRSLLASLMALSLLCGGLGVASAVDVVHVDESASGGIAGVYTTTKVDTLLAEYGRKEDVENNRNSITTLQNMTTDQGQKITANTTDIANIKTAIDKKIDTVTADARYATRTELTAKADATALGTKANTSLDNLNDAGKSVIKTMMADELAKKADKSYVDNAVAGAVTTAGTNVNEKLKDYAKTTYVDTEVGKKANKATTLAGYEITDAYTKGEVYNKGEVARKLDKKADQTALDQATGKINDQQTAIGNLNEKTTEISYAAGDGTKISGVRITDGNIVGNGNSAITQLANVETDKIETDSINGKSLTGTTVATEKEVKDVADAVKAETDARTEADNKLEGKINKNTQDIATLNESSVKYDTAVKDTITLDGAGGTTITHLKEATLSDSSTDAVTGKQLYKTNVELEAETTARTDKDTELEKGIAKNSGDITALDGKIKTNADNIQINKDAIAATDKRTGGITRNDAANETKIEGNVTVDNLGNVTAKGNVTAEGQLTGKGVDAGAGDITTEGAVKAGSLTVTDASTLKGDVTMNQKLNVTGDTSLNKTDVNGALTAKGDVILGTNTAQTVTVNGIADFNEAVNMDNGLTVDKGLTVTGDTNLENTTVDGNLKVTGTITTDKMVFGDPATNNYTEIDHGKVTSKNQVNNGAGEIISSSSTFNAKENKVGFANSATGDQSFHKQTSDIIMDNVKDRDNSNNRTQTKTETKDIITDKDGNSSTTSQTASENKTYLKDKDGKNTNSTSDTAKGYDKTIKGENGETSTKQDELNITNTAKDGTITNDAKDIVNTATTMKTTVTGKATESYGELETTVNGNETHTVTGNQDIHVTGKQTNTVEGGQENIISGGQTNTITGDQTTIITGNKTETVTENVTEDYKKDLTTTVGGNENHEVKGTKTETVEGKVTENYNGGQETNVTGDQVIKVSGTQTTTATDINRNASSGMIDTIDNDYGTNTETKVAGKTTTDVSIKGTGEEGKYIRGANESRDYLIKGTLKNSETKTVDATSTEITDGKGKTSATIQDVNNLAGSVTNGTETGVSGIHANKDGSVSIDSAVSGEGGSSVINQKKDSITSSVGNADGSISTVIRQDKDNVIIASSNGMVGIVGKDIVNKASENITNTAKNITNEATETLTDKVGENTRVTTSTSITDTVGTANRKIEDGKITDTAGDSTVTTENKKGTTFAKTGSKAYSTKEGAPKDTNIAGNHITTGRVDANELAVSDKDGANTADLSVKAGEGVKASAGNGTTTGSLDVTADEVVSSVTNTDGTHTNMSQTADGIKGYATDKDGNKTYTKVTATENSFQVQDKDGKNKNHQVNTMGSSVTEITDKDGNTTKTEQTATDITNEASNSITDKVGTNTRVLNKDGITDTVGGSTFKQRINAIMMESKDVSIEAEETLTNEAKVITNKASEVINNEAININNTATGIITSKASEIKNQADKLISNKVGENTWENMEDGKITTSIKDGTKQNLTQSDAAGTTQSTVDGGKSTVTIQNADGLTHAVNNGTSINASATTATSSAQTILSGGKANSVITTIDGTQFVNSEAAAPVTGASGANPGTADRTTIKGNTITTGKVTMDYADVMKDLGVRGNANITGKTTTGSLEVKGESKLTGNVTMENNATVGNDLTVKGITTTKTLKVTENAEIDGNATIKGDVTANSYKVGDKTYIDANGINANDQKITNVADGSISEGSKDAVNGGQLYTVKNDLEGKVNKVGANAAAMANLHPMEFDPDSKWNIAAAIGNYGSETAAALGAFYRPNDDVMVNLSTAFGTGENMVGGGVSVRLGKGGNKLSREESNALKDQVNDLTARMDALLSVLNPNMSKDFPDVPENHWAYEAVSRLAGNDIIQGYPDGEFHGERTMTRYEMAEIIYNALSRGAEAEKELVEEFKPELQAMAASEKATAERAEG